jgi:ISXO2-like transposase domain/Transposase zinc-ribbon domain
VLYEVRVASEGVVIGPIAGVDYPRSWPEFLAFFPDEEACLRYLERVRWPDGFRCPACGHGEAWRTKRGLRVCGACERQTSVTAGTLLAGTRTPLVSWFMSVWQLTNQKHGLSAMGLQRLLGLRSYETAWAHMHKLRRAMVRPDRDQLTDVVEVDESYVGGEESGVDGRQTFAKALVICAVEVRTRGEREFAGRIRMSRIPAATGVAVEEFITTTVERGTRVRTDGLPSYRGLHGLGYAHDPIVISRTGLPASAVMPHVHRAFALLKRWLLGTYQGGVQPHQLDYYLDEFAFRFNRRRSRHRGLLFYRLLQEVVATEPIALTRLVGGRHGRAGTSRQHAE